MNGEPLLLTVAEAARRLSISRSKMYELLTAERIESVKISRSRRVPLVACEEYVARLRTEDEIDTRPRA
jgi:excisionase family DNA binding protein